MKNTKEVKYNSVNEYYESLSRPARAAFLVGIRYALKIMRNANASKSEMNEMIALLK